jgi:hypothetical protein
MKKIILILCVLVMPCAYFGVRAEEAVTNITAPNLSVSPESWDFGPIIEGDTATHIFLIKNTGNGELKIINVRSACGCTAALLSSKNIAPGQSTELKVSFNSNNYRSNFEKQVYLTSNDPDEPSKTITVKGSVTALPKISVRVDPPVWEFAHGVSGKTSTPQFLIINNGVNALRISSIDPQSNAVKSSVASADIEPGKSKKVDLNLMPRAEIEKKDGYMSIKIDVPYRYPAK